MTPPKTPPKKTSVDLPPTLWAKVKHQCIQDNLTFNKFTINALEALLKSRKTDVVHPAKKGGKK